MLIKKIMRLAFTLLVEISPVLASKVIYYKTFGKRLNLKNPTTFNEKLMWLKLTEDDELKAHCTDKYLVRDYVRDRGLGDILIDTYDMYERAEQIDFDKLPDRFVMKCTHGSGFNIVCANKYFLEKAHTLAQLKKWMQTDYSLYCCEPHYAKIRPRILVEQFIGERGGKLPTDYKIHCFHGQPEVIEVIADRDTPNRKNILFSCDWTLLPYTKEALEVGESWERPQNLTEMLRVARTLSEAFTYVRVDLYSVENKVYFGELTFTPAACVDTDLLQEADVQLGRLLDLTNVGLTKTPELMQ